MPGESFRSGEPVGVEKCAPIKGGGFWKRIKSLIIV